MTRGRKFRSTRRSAESERSLFEQRLTGRYSRMLDRTDLLNLVRGGEDTHLEFKLRLVNTEKIVAEIVAMANSAGGAILFGVNDQRRIEGLDDPEQVEDQLIDICRNQIKPPLLPRIDKVAFDNGIRIVVLQVDDRRAPHSTPDNRYFVRIGSTKNEANGDEIAALFARSRVASFEDMPVISATVEDTDEALVWSYVRDLEGDLFREPKGFPTGDVLRELKLATSYGATVAPTLAGLLLFGRTTAIERALPQSRITLIRFSGANAESPVVERTEFSGNVTSLFDRSMHFIKRYVDLWDARPRRGAVGSFPESAAADPIPPRPNYSRDVVIESLTNLLMHRDYSMVGSPSRVLLFDGKIEFINASRSDGASKRSVEYGVPGRRNARLHHIFTSLEYGVERAGRGIPALRRLHYEFTKREPRLSLLGDEFRFEIYSV
jgi:ATP-dependent DNA helicase RecG